MNSMTEPEIHVEATLFGPIPGVDPHLSKDATILIESSQPEKAAQALARAAAIFPKVAEDGQIFTNEQFWENAMSPRPLYTPSYVSPVYRSERGPFVLIDANAYVPSGMARTMIRLVSDELISAGVTEATLCPARDIPAPQDLQIWVDYEPLT